MFLDLVFLEFLILHQFLIIHRDGSWVRLLKAVDNSKFNCICLQDAVQEISWSMARQAHEDTQNLWP